MTSQKTQVKSNQAAAKLSAMMNLCFYSWAGQALPFSNSICLHCLGNTCAPPESIANATYTITSLAVGGSVLYTCDYGYVATSGNLTMACDSNGQWKGYLPTCSGSSYTSHWKNCTKAWKRVHPCWAYF